MDQLIVEIATWMLKIEVVLVILFVLVNYMIRLYHYLILRDRLGVTDRIEGIFYFYIKNDIDFSSKDMKFFNKNILYVLRVLESFNVPQDLIEEWKQFRKKLILTLFYPRGKQLYNSWRAYRRYYAARCFFAHFEETDAHMVIKLINDPVLLVSLNASRVAFKYRSPALINASIDVFSKYRKIQQSIFSSIAHQHGEDVEKIVISRLSIESNPFVKAFCYRLLQQLPIKDQIDDMLTHDLSSGSLDLQVSALTYCACSPKYYHFLGKFIDNEKWQLRAASAELIGKVKLTKALPVLAKRIYNHEWWVRIRTAEALGKLGEEGISVLKSQDPKIDRYAYDAAQQVLDALLSEKPSWQS